MNSRAMTDAPDRRAQFKAIYEEKFPFVIFILRRLRVSENEIEELTHDTFLSYFRHANSIDPERTNAWLATTARNLAFDSFRKQKSRRTEVNGAEVARAPCERCEDEDVLEREDRAARVAGALESWSLKNRSALLFDFYLRGKSVRTLGEERGLRVSSITSALTRQRRQFRASLMDPSSEHAH